MMENHAKWIHMDKNMDSAVLIKKIELSGKIKKAELSIYGLGLYEIYIDGEYVGDEYLQPGYHSYDLVNEYRVLNVTEMLRGNVLNHELKVLLGNGWYKGRFIFEGGFENLYGDHLKLIASMSIEYEDGTHGVITTDDSWKAFTSEIGKNNIYDGEELDYRLAGKAVTFTVSKDGKDLLSERTSPRLLKVEKIRPKQLIITPKGEQVIDFGEAISGWVEFVCHEEKDTVVKLQFGEWMVDGCFYRENLRTAEAVFSYVSEGKEIKVRPHFTYFGFRYVKIIGVSKIELKDFEACRIMSECPENGKIVTGNEKVNRLLLNALNSQKCNFFDIPTDCPQRDERLGWTGDISIFADTACFNLDSKKFLSHYMEMVDLESQLTDGAVGFFVPTPKIHFTKSDKEYNPFLTMKRGTAVWGDAATIIPWTLYEHYHDLKLLEKQYPVMKRWAYYVKRRTEENKNTYLWQNDVQLGDWLALDAKDSDGVFGLTDPDYIASAYFYYTCCLCCLAAKELKLENEVKYFADQLKNIKQKFLEFYFDEEGKLKIIETQTACAIALKFNLYPKGSREYLISKLKLLLNENDNKLSTGFVGTAILPTVLSENGMHEIACELLLNEEYPGWLYTVNLGAVSIWERWNSVNPDGTMNSYGMNSLNHYAYGSIVGWMYRYICGFIPIASQMQKIIISPQYCKNLEFVNGEYNTPWGCYESKWREDGEYINYTIIVPEKGEAVLRLPGIEEVTLKAGRYEYRIKNIK